MVTYNVLRVMVLATGLLSIAVSAVAGGPTPVTTTVCELLVHANAYDGKIVAIRATFQGQLMERQYIVDESCLKHGRIAIAQDDALPNSEHLINLAHALNQARIASTQSRPSTVTSFLVGVFHRKSPSGRGPELRLTDATSIEVVARPQLEFSIPRKGK